MNFRDKILTADTLPAWREALRKEGRALAVTNGCFDILHVGHVSYLISARNLGDALMVGLNSDRSINGLKGPYRPVIPEQDRARILAALEAVDVVCLFDEENPVRLIRQVMPDVLVKGGDYLPEKIVGYEEVTMNGGTVEVIPLLEGYSTTGLIQKIKEQP